MARRKNFKVPILGAFGSGTKKTVLNSGSKKSMRTFTFEERRILLDLTNLGIKSKVATDFLKKPIAGMKTERLDAISNAIEKRLEQGGINPEKKKLLETIMQKILDVLNKRNVDLAKQSPNPIILGTKTKDRKRRN